MSSSASTAATRFPDLVQDTRLDTSFEGDLTIHHYDDSDGEQDARPERRSEYWKRERFLGEGGYGAVYQETLVKWVRGKPRHKTRAVKQIVVRDPQLSYPSELEAIAKFSQRRYSKYFVKMFGWYATAQNLCIVMEYFNLGDLHNYLDKHGAMAEPDVQTVTRQVLSGLDYMHQGGFAHRDIKPSNILIKARAPDAWWVKIGDFGISKRLSATMEQFSGPSGTPGYIAPELLMGASEEAYLVKHQSADMWALGVTVFCMLTNAQPFRSVQELLRYMATPDTFSSKIWETIGKSPSFFVRSLMNPSPEERLIPAKAKNHEWFSIPQTSESTRDTPFSPGEIHTPPRRAYEPASTTPKEPSPRSSPGTLPLDDFNQAPMGNSVELLKSVRPASRARRSPHRSSAYPEPEPEASGRWTTLGSEQTEFEPSPIGRQAISSTERVVGSAIVVSSKDLETSSETKGLPRFESYAEAATLQPIDFSDTVSPQDLQSSFTPKTRRPRRRASPRASGQVRPPSNLPISTAGIIENTSATSEKPLRHPASIGIETSIENTPSELTEDVVKPVDDKSSYLIPEDGTPITIVTRGHNARKSQTSLLIEYFEGGKPASGSSGQRRPSVRVRLTPTKKGRADQNLQVKEGGQNALATRIIPLDLRSRRRRRPVSPLIADIPVADKSNVAIDPVDTELDRNH